MSDLISRQAAIDAMEESKRIYVDRRVIIGKMQDIVNNLPSAQQERKRGRWIRNDNGTYSCSVCQSWIPEEQHFYARYCLCCGADMRGEER